MLSIPPSAAAQSYLLKCLYVGIERAAEDHVLAVKALSEQESLAAKPDRDFMEDMLVDPSARERDAATIVSSETAGRELLAMWRDAHDLPVDAGTMDIIWRQECDNARRRSAAEPGP